MLLFAFSGLFVLAAVGSLLLDHLSFLSFALGGMICLCFAVSLTISTLSRKIPHLAPKDIPLRISTIFLLSLLIMPFFGALPFYFVYPQSPFFGSFYLESLLCLTTTGGSFLPYSLPVYLQFWKALMAWFGGFLHLFCMSAILLNLFLEDTFSSRQLFRRQITLFHPFPKGLVMKIGGTYLLLTAVCWLLLQFSGMEKWSSLFYALSSLSTTGLTLKGLMFPPLSPSSMLVLSVFVLIGALSFLHLPLLFGDKSSRKIFFQDQQFRLLMGLFLGATAMMSVYVFFSGRSVSVFDSLFAGLTFCANTLSTTGWAFDKTLPLTAFPTLTALVLMGIGGCWVSTAGGLKIFPAFIFVKGAVLGLYKLAFPHRVFGIFYHTTLLKIQWFRILWFMALVCLFVVLLSALLFTAYDYDVPTALTLSLIALSNTGGELGFLTMETLSDWSSLSSPVVRLTAGGLLLGGRCGLFVLFIAATRFFQTVPPSSFSGAER